MKIIKKELNKDGSVLLTLDQPIRIGNFDSIFRDNKMIEYRTSADNQIESLYAVSDNYDYPIILKELGIVYISHNNRKNKPKLRTIKIQTDIIKAEL